MSSRVEVLLGLGGNLGDRAGYLQRAVARLSSGEAPVLRNPHCSAVYESPALLPEGGAEQGWDMPFLNMAVCGDTALSPRALLAAVKVLETELGRHPHARWAPREIDIDILAYGDLTMCEPELTIPHPAVLDRDFVLLPLADIVPDRTLPGMRRTLGEYAAAITSSLAKTPIEIRL